METFLSWKQAIVCRLKDQWPMPFTEEPEICLLKKNYYGNVTFNGNFQTTVKIYKWDPLMIVTLKWSTKAAMTGAFRRAAWTKPSRCKLLWSYSFTENCQCTFKIFQSDLHQVDPLTLLWRRSLSYWNQEIDLLCKSMG